MKQTLLIADGNAASCDLYARFLTENGYEVATSWDGLDCLVKLYRVQPAVLVLDLELRWGGSDGVLARLREENHIPWVPVILIATAGLGTEDELVEPPVVQRLSKPFPLTTLLESIRSAAAMGPMKARSTSPASRWSELFLG